MQPRPRKKEGKAETVVSRAGRMWLQDKQKCGLERVDDQRTNTKRTGLPGRIKRQRKHDG